jgi:hypothetical protein
MRLPQKKILKIFLTLILLTGSLLFVQTVFAQNFGLNEVNSTIALVNGDPRVIAARLIRVALGFLGLIALVIVLYGGFVWMTSGGNEEKISKAKKILTNGLIGLIIILMAVGITQYVLNTLVAALTGAEGGGGPSSSSVIIHNSGDLGNGIIESHYPPRGGTDIPRNTKIIITFKEPMALDSFIKGYDTNGTPDNLLDDKLGGSAIVTGAVFPLNTDNIRIYPSLQGEYGAPPTPGAPQPENFLPSSGASVTFTPDLKTFVFTPKDYLGSPTQNISYTVSLKSGIKKADGSNAFGTFGDGYAWDFEVSTIIDVTPPQVERVIPDVGVTEARNVLVQVNFNEAMDPTTVTGKTTDHPAFDNIEVLADGTAVNGTWTIGNQYKTIEFATDFKCGTNSCGGDVFCLPAPVAPATTRPITVTVKAADLGTTPPAAVYPYTGATDVVGNSLDGNKNGTAEGPTADNYVWTFNVNNKIDLVPPRIDSVTPGPPSATTLDWPAGINNVSLAAPIEITFSKLMSITSFTSENIILADDEQPKCAVWFENGGQNFTRADGASVTKAKISHGNFIESVTDTALPAPSCDGTPVNERLVKYFPRATQNVKDIYQNCFFTPPAAGPQGPAGGTTCTAQGGACQWPVE